MTDQQEYNVRIEPHGRSIRVAADRPILDAALAAGLNLPHSCKSGHCSSCRARLRSGQIRYPAARPPGVTEEEARAGNILLCQARALSDLVVEARFIASVADVEIKTLPCRVDRVVPLAPDVMQVFLRLPSVETLRFHPGQYIDVLLDGGRRRSFSIASPPHDSELIELHVRRVAGGDFTERLFAQAPPVSQPPASSAPGSLAGTPTPGAASLASLAPAMTSGPPIHSGTLLKIEGPLGQFAWRSGTAPVLMIAGGTGFAPLKSMLRHILERGGTERAVHLYWGARQAHDVYEEALVLDWARHHPNFRFTAVLSDANDPGANHRLLGLVHEAVLADHPQLNSFEVYAAGPPAMIEAIRATFPRHGLPESQLHFDSFDYSPDRALPAR